MLSVDDERDALARILEQSKLRRETLHIPVHQPSLRPPRTNNRKHRSNSRQRSSATPDAAATSSAAVALKQRKQQAYGPAYKPDEESLREDFAQEYVNSGRRPQNFLLGTDLDKRFDEYPRLQKLLTLHSGLVHQLAIPPTYLQAPSLHDFDFLSLAPTRFDCILIDPPDELSWATLATLPMPSVAAQPSFIWVWCGSGNTDGLERGRDLLSRWGYRRCEDIVWIKTNKTSKQDPGTPSVFTQTKEHCLMGIRGTVKRSTDAHFVHCNVDTDVIVWEPDPEDPSAKPPEIYNIIENFCLGSRRLQLFYPPSKARRGWLTIGKEDLTQPQIASGVEAYDKPTFDAYFDPTQGGAVTVPNTPEIDSLRPRSPPPRGGQPNQSGGGIGRGRGALAGGVRPHSSTPGLASLPPKPQTAALLPPMPMSSMPHHSMGMPMALHAQQQQQQQQHPYPMQTSASVGPPLGGSGSASATPQPFHPMHQQPFNPMMAGGFPGPQMFNPAMMMGAPMMPQMPQMDWTAFFQQQAQQRQRR